MCLRYVHAGLLVLACVASSWACAGQAPSVSPPPQGAARPTATLDLWIDYHLQQCINEADVRERAKAELGYDPFVDDAPAHVTLRFRRLGLNFVATIDTVRADGTHVAHTVRGLITRCGTVAKDVAKHLRASLR